MHVTLASPTPELMAARALAPWAEPLARWPDALFVDRPSGLSRNEVRFTALAGRVYAVKEGQPRFIAREYAMLRAMREAKLPVVEPAAVFENRASGSSLLVTKFLEFALPLREILSDPCASVTSERLVESLTNLLVRLHLAGFFWGDLSLSNALFRRDAGLLAAYLVDAETTERHHPLSEGLRAQDLEIAAQNVAGELMDLAAGPGLPEGLEPLAVAEALVARYERLWSELHEETRVPLDDAGAVALLTVRLNALGFEVDEVEIVTDEAAGEAIVKPKLVEGGHRRRALRRLTGLDAEENQSRELLDDIRRFKAWHAAACGERLDLETAAARWKSEVFEPTVGAAPDALRARLGDAEIFHQVLEHRWFMSERAGRDVGTPAALGDYLDATAEAELGAPQLAEESAP